MTMILSVHINICKDSVFILKHNYYDRKSSEPAGSILFMSKPCHACHQVGPSGQKSQLIYRYFLACLAHTHRLLARNITERCGQQLTMPSLTGSNFPAQAARLQGGHLRAASPPRQIASRTEQMRLSAGTRHAIVQCKRNCKRNFMAYLSVSASAVPMRAAFMPPTSVSKIQSNGLVSAFPCHAFPCIYFLFRGIFSFHLCWCEIFKLIQDEPVKLGDARCLPVANVVQPGRPLQHCRNSGTAMWRRKTRRGKAEVENPVHMTMTKSTQSVNEEFDSPGDMRFLKYQFPSPGRTVYVHCQADDQMKQSTDWNLAT